MIQQSHSQVREMKTYVHINVSICLVVVALFIITKNWKIKMFMNCGKDKQNMVFHTKEKYSTLKVINY